jgi:hypothetical protein
MEWHHPNSWKKEFKDTLSLEKVMANVFWDAEGVTLAGTTPHGQTINYDLYIQTSKTLQKDFKRVQTQKSIAEILLQHNNTQ